MLLQLISDAFQTTDVKIGDIIADFLEEFCYDRPEVDIYIKRLRSGHLRIQTLLDVIYKFGTRKERKKIRQAERHYKRKFWTSNKSIVRKYKRYKDSFYRWSVSHHFIWEALSMEASELKQGDVFKTYEDDLNKEYKLLKTDFSTGCFIYATELLTCPDKLYRFPNDIPVVLVQRKSDEEAVNR